MIMTPITSPSPGEGACSAAFPPWTASRIRERLGAFLHDGSLASWAGPHVLRRAADGTPFVGGTAIRQLAAGAVLPEREVMVALLQDGIWPERFRRNYGVFSADAMVRLLQTRVFVLGCGGLGGHVASLLARLGVGGLRLCDSDIFEESNLNRQYFCTESTLGQPKAVATARGLRDMAGYLALDVRHVEADEKNLPDMLQDVDVALDCLDDLALKMLLEERSAAAGVPFVHGSVLRAEGFARAARSGRLHLRELYASGLTSEEAGSARHEGVIATAPAGVACLMVSLCLRLLVHIDASELHLSGKFLGQRLKYRRLHFTRSAPLCPEIQNDRHLCRQHLVLKIFICNCNNCHILLPFCAFRRHCFLPAAALTHALFPAELREYQTFVPV